MRFAVFILAGLVVVGLLFWLFKPEPTITNYPSPGTDIIAFGDSLIEGVGATSGNDLVSQLEREINQPIINLGVGGDTTKDGLARIDSVTRHDPKIVLVLLGGNDAIRKVSIKETKNNLEAIIKDIHATGAVVVLLGVRGGLLGNKDFDDMYEDLVKEHHTAFVPDILAEVFGRASLMSDSIHPNDAGYTKIKERVLPALEAVLKD